MLYREYPTKLAKLRQEFGLSQKELAEQLGVSQASINYWEKGQRTPSVEAAKKLSHFFNTPIPELFESTNEEINTERPNSNINYAYLAYRNRKLEDIVKNTEDAQERSDAMNEHLNNTLLSKKLENEDIEYIARIYGSLNSDGKEIIKGVCESVIKNEDYRGMIDTKLPPELLKEIFKRK